MKAAMMSLKYWLLFREKTAIYCEDYGKHMNELTGKIYQSFFYSPTNAQVNCLKNNFNVNF